MIKIPNPTLQSAERLSESARQVFNLLCWLERRFKGAFPSQGYIARKVGITRIHCNRLIAELEEGGFIEKLVRPWHSCIYKIHPMFWFEQTRTKFYKIFKSLSWICLVLLMSPHPMYREKGIQLEYVTRILEERELLRKYNNSPLSLSYSSSSYIRLSKKGREFLSDITITHTVNPSPEASYLSNIKSLRLTKWGQIKLSVFPEDAISYADSFTDHIKKAREPFKYFVTLCSNYCRDHSLEINYTLFYALQSMYGTKDNAPMLLPDESRTQSSPSTVSRQLQPVTKRHELSEKEDYYKRADDYGRAKPVYRPKVEGKRKLTTKEALELARETIARRQIDYTVEVQQKAQEMRKKMGINPNGTFVDTNISNAEMIHRLFTMYRTMRF